MKKLLIAAVALTALAVPASAFDQNAYQLRLLNQQIQQQNMYIQQENLRRQNEAAGQAIGEAIGGYVQKRRAAKEELFWIKANNAVPRNLIGAYCKDVYAYKYGGFLTRKRATNECLAALK